MLLVPLAVIFGYHFGVQRVHAYAVAKDLTLEQYTAKFESYKAGLTSHPHSIAFHVVTLVAGTLILWVFFEVVSMFLALAFEKLLSKSLSVEASA